MIKIFCESNHTPKVPGESFEQDINRFLASLKSHRYQLHVCAKGSYHYPYIVVDY
jgi:hypothetical protein